MTTVPILLGFNGSNYQVTRSLRFRASASAYLNRTPSVASSQTTWTWSGWVKRGSLTSGGNFTIFSAGVSAQPYALISFSSDQLAFDCINSGSVVVGRRYTSAVYRDPSAWYHIVAVWDTTNTTAASRMRLYVNGVQVTAFSLSSDPALNATTQVNTTAAHYFGEYPGGGNYFDGYLAEVNFIDGQALTPSSFGYFDLYGVWQPKKYNGTFGTNGFYLPFSNTTSTTTLVADSSGNGNNWTANNISLTAGTTYDSMLDSPTNYADGGNGRGNYAVLNPLPKNGVQNGTYTTATISNGNLLATGGAINTTWTACSSMVLPTTGKWYFEVTMSATAYGNGAAGLFSLSNSSANCYARLAVGVILNGSTSYAYTGYNTGSTNRIGIAYDADNNKYWQTDINGTWLNSKTPGVDTTGLVSGLTAAGDYVVGWFYNSGGESNLTASVNFGQQPFSYTQPTGFNALNTQNLPAAPVPYGAPYMNAITYTGYGPLVPSGLGILTKRNASTQNVSKSLRFRASASAYLNRTPASAGNRKTWTWSGWVKIGTSTSAMGVMSAGTDGNNWTGFRFNTDSTFAFYRVGPGGGTTTYLQTNQLFRDPTAWYHIVLQWDTTQATSTNRIKLYVNGSQVTAFSTTSYPVQNYDEAFFNTAVAHLFGNITSVTQYLDGYVAEVNFIDGQALTPSSFGQTNNDGIWVPKAYTGTYGTNGFYLPFTNTTSTTTLVADSSGNGNNWTPNNISLTAGTTYDSMIDSPTDYASAGNYAVGNPLNLGASTTLTNANMLFTSTSAAYRTATATIAMSSGSWYFEITAGANSAGENVLVGIQSLNENLQTNYVGSSATSYSYTSSGKKYNNGSNSAYGASWTQNDVIGIAFDGSNLSFYKNGTSQGNAYTGLSGTFLFAVSAYNSSASINFGQQPFVYAAPSGYFTLNTYNITAPSTTWFSSANNSGNASATAYPDFVWIKSRSSAQNHSLNDTLRGPTLNILSNSTAAEAGASTMFAVNKYGLTLGNDASVNSSSYTDVMWGWQGGNGTTSTNTSGTITSQVSASTTSGFSIVTWTYNSSGGTIGHGLGVAPSMILQKVRTNGAYNWDVYHISTGATKRLILNATDAASTFSGPWNNTSPTSSVFSSGASWYTNGDSMVSYCFAAIRGFSAFGSYTGNGSTDGPFIYTGFRPRFILTKCSSNSTASTVWTIWDTSRNTYNASVNELYPNSSGAELVDSSGIDILSNGFKPKRNSEYANFSGWTYVYAAFAENPFNMSRAR